MLTISNKYVCEEQKHYKSMWKNSECFYHKEIINDGWGKYL